MIHPIAINCLLSCWLGVLAFGGQPPEVRSPVLTGRCAQDLPLDAGEGFEHQRFLVLQDGIRLFKEDWKGPTIRWQLTSRLTPDAPGTSQGLLRTRLKWRDGALWTMRDHRVLRWDAQARQWLQRADPGLEFMDFEVDLTGRILLVCTADPRTRTYRALLEAVEPGGRETTVLAPYPDPGSQTWAGKVPPVAAASLQVGYEAVQILEFTVLFNPLARRLFIFRPLEDRLKEVKLGLPVRGYADLAQPGPLQDLCWQVLPKDATEAWVVMKHVGEEGVGGLSALPLDLFEATAGPPRWLPGNLPVYPDPQGRLLGLDEAVAAYGQAP